MKMTPKILLIGLFTITLLAATSMAQELPHNEFSVQGTGFFTSDSNNNGNGIAEHSTNTGGFLVSYRNYFTRIFGADISYGYSRNTQLTFAGGPPLRVQSDIHQTTAAMVVRAPHRVFGFRPFLLAGVGALTFNPTNNLGGTILGADTQAKPAFVYGGGADYDLGDHFAIRIAYRGLVYGRPDFGLPGLNSDTVTHTAQPSAGFVFRF